MVIVGDDCALLSSSDDANADMRRGIAGTVLVHKIAGAAAEEGKSLEEVTSIAQQVASGNIDVCVCVCVCFC